MQRSEEFIEEFENKKITGKGWSPECWIIPKLFADFEFAGLTNEKKIIICPYDTYPWYLWKEPELIPDWKASELWVKYRFSDDQIHRALKMLNGLYALIGVSGCAVKMATKFEIQRHFEICDRPDDYKKYGAF